MANVTAIVLIVVSVLLIAIVFVMVAYNRYSCKGNTCDKTWFGTYSSEDKCKENCGGSVKPGMSGNSSGIVGHQCVQTPENDYKCVPMSEGNPDDYFQTRGDCVDACKPEVDIVSYPSYYPVYGYGYGFPYGYGRRRWGHGGHWGGWRGGRGGGRGGGGRGGGRGGGGRGGGGRGGGP